MLRTKKIEYQEGHTLLEGYYAFEDSKSGKRPAVLVSHDWSGKNDFSCKKAEKLAELGYVGFALDMYGKGVVGNTNEEKMALMKPFMEDRALIQRRMLAAFEVVKTLDFVDATKIAAIGFCFGGLCALDLARSGAELLGVVSFHGLLNAPEKPSHKSIHAKVLALHGYQDPMGNPEQLLNFEKEMTEAKVDWQVHIYGNAHHAFTNPNANDPESGLIYDSLADKRSWIAMKNFFTELFQT